MSENAFSANVNHHSTGIIILFLFVGLLLVPLFLIAQASGPITQSNNTIGSASSDEAAQSSVNFVNISANEISICRKVTQTVNPIDISVYRPTSFSTKTDPNGSTSIPSSTLVTLCVPGFGGPTERILPIEIVFSIDSSSSMIQNDPSNLRLEAAKSFVDRLNATQDQAGIVSWGRSVDFSFGLTRDFEKLKAAIDLIESSGGT